ncbi:MAG: SAM-dependent methyltransferase [Pseudomonadota bacterium]|nr:SAM-dependent methyltransferase [Pseudomonadota bacterium]
MSTPPLDGRADLEARLGALTTFLLDTQPFWQARPFAALPLPWEAEHPALSAWLRALPLHKADALHADPARLREAPGPLPGLVAEVARLTAMGPLPAAPHAALPDPFARVTGRKLHQVQALVAAAEAVFPDGIELVVDWCCGKGHLGRTLSAAQGVVTLGLERNAELCRTARDLAASTDARCAFLPTDVLDREHWPAVPPLRTAVVGLHACGALTDAAMHFAVEGHARAVLLAPCCFHHVPGEDPFVPRSVLGRAAGLTWDDPTLRLPTLEEVVASAAVRRRRRHEFGWRLGLDLLVQASTGAQAYTPLGPLPPGWHRGDFQMFAEHMAGAASLPLPPGWDPARAEAAGHDRARLVAALGLVRSQFRRPFELWLVLDRALRLADAGWEVAVGTFCDREVTPRNLAIVGWHPAATR